MKLAKKEETNKPDRALGMLSKTTFHAHKSRKSPAGSRAQNNSTLSSTFIPPTSPLNKHHSSSKYSWIRILLLPVQTSHPGPSEYYSKNPKGVQISKHCPSPVSSFILYTYNYRSGMKRGQEMLPERPDPNIDNFTTTIGLKASGPTPYHSC